MYPLFHNEVLVNDLYVMVPKTTDQTTCPVIRFMLLADGNWVVSVFNFVTKEPMETDQCVVRDTTTEEDIPVGLNSFVMTPGTGPYGVRARRLRNWTRRAIGWFTVYRKRKRMCHPECRWNGMRLNV